MSSEAGLLEGLELFYGAASNNLARVYARLVTIGALHAPYEEMSLSGFVRGPECEYGRTLPATTKLVDRGPGESLLAEAIVPDPCFWTPDVPSRYRVHVELRRGGAVVETVERELAIRNFGPRGKSLFLEGQRWVLRGVCADNPSVAELPDWREARAAMVVTEPSDELCREATRLGVFLVAYVGGSGDEVFLELHRLARFGAVAVAIIQSGEIAIGELRRAAPNLVFAQDIGRDSPILLGNSPPYYTFPGAEMAFVEVGESVRYFATRVGNSLHPVVAWRRNHDSLSISEARVAIDDLQRDLAPYGDYAGYVV